MDRFPGWTADRIVGGGLGCWAGCSQLWSRRLQLELKSGQPDLGFEDGSDHPYRPLHSPPLPWIGSNGVVSEESKSQWNVPKRFKIIFWGVVVYVLLSNNSFFTWAELCLLELVLALSDLLQRSTCGRFWLFLVPPVESSESLPLRTKHFALSLCSSTRNRSFIDHNFRAFSCKNLICSEYQKPQFEYL